MVDFDLYESLRYDSEAGFSLLEAHLDRMAHSARHFDFTFDRKRVTAALDDAVAPLEGIFKVRLLLAVDGSHRIEHAPIAPHSSTVTLAIARTPVRSDDELLRHKTTNRGVYERALGECSAADDVLLVNEAGELTEASSANVVVRRDGVLVTPPLAAGLLPGTLRGHLLGRGELTEAPLRVADRAGWAAIYLINSVRGWRLGNLLADHIA